MENGEKTKKIYEKRHRKKNIQTKNCGTRISTNKNTHKGKYMNKKYMDGKFPR